MNTKAKLLAESLEAKGDMLELVDPNNRMKVYFDSKKKVISVSGGIEQSLEKYDFEFDSVSSFYQWLSILNISHTCLYSSLKPMNIVYSEETNVVVSIHDTQTLCDEVSNDQYRLFKKKLGCSRIHVPWGMMDQDVVGRHLSEFRY